jgi:drug/metabolite transporter (DMT)-like permease
LGNDLEIAQATANGCPVSLQNPHNRSAAMTAKLLTLALIVASLVGYQLAQRAMPTGANPFSVVALAYVLGIVACVLLAPRVGNPIGPADVVLLTQWPIWALAGSVVGIEIGYLLAYRAGWPLGTTTGITYTASMVLLAVIGAACFSEGMTLRRSAGIVLAIGGVWLLVTPSRTP